MDRSSIFNKSNLWIVCIILLSTLLILVMSTKKINYNLDELLTYSLANSTSYINFVPGEKYDSYGKLQEKFLTTNDKTKFNYSNVWRNQANDVHPPFYYAIIHTISSFIPGVFSKYIGISVNIFFNALIILLLYKLSILITNKKSIAFITSLFWAVNPGILSDMMFIRMYVMAMFFCLFISYVHIKHFNNVTPNNYKFYLSLFLVSLTGSLTHYYFIVFNFFISAFFVFLLLYRKRIKELLMYIGTYILTFISVLVIFPSAYNQILGKGYRGEESMSNFTSTNLNDYIQSIKFFWTTISGNLFGGYLLLLVLIIIIVTSITLKLRKKRISDGLLESQSIFKIVFLIIACFLYFILISKIAVYSQERYVQPIFPILILIFVPLVYQLVKRFFRENITIFIVCLLLLSISFSGYIKTTSFMYLESSSEKAIQISEQYSNKNVIYIYDKVWKIPTNYIELSHYKSVTFYNINNLDSLYHNTNYSDFIVYTHSRDESFIKSIVKKLPNITRFKKLNSYGYCNVYYLE